MRYFKEMVKHVRTQGITFGQQDQNTKAKLTAAFWSSVEKNEIFVFMPNGKPVQDIEYNIYHDTKIDAPFEVFSMEMAGDKQYIAIPKIDDDIPANIACIMYVENLGPQYPNGGCFMFSILHDTFGLGMLKQAWHRYKNPVPLVTFNNLEGGVNVIIEKYLARLNSEKDGLETIEREVIMVPSGKEGSKKKPVPIRRVFHIAPKTQIVKYTGSAPGKREINWTHNWPVRGTFMHFADKSRIGKNRDGEYVEVGKTWRKAHIKGNLDGPLISKMKIVDAPKEAEL